MKVVDDARDRGLDVTCDVCVHMWGGDSLANLVIPDWAFEGGLGEMLERLKDPAIREKMKVESSQKGKAIHLLVMGSGVT